MFEFTLARAKQTWRGQGDVWGEGGMLPYLGGDSLGLCYGMSAVWIKSGAPADAAAIVRGNKETILEIQTEITENAAADESAMLEAGADAAGLAVLRTDTYDPPASYMILDMLARTDTHHYLVSFYYTAGGAHDAGHAVGVSFDSSSSGKIFDPNYGVASYDSRTLLCNDLHKMLGGYVPGAHSVTKIFVQAVDNEDAFGDFVGV